MKIAGVLLAAGSSQRFGAQDKLLAELAGKPLASYAANALALAPLAVRLAVVRPGNAALQSILQPLGFRLVANPAAAAGQGTSIAAVMRDLPPDCDGALIMPADMPLVGTDLVARVIAAWAGAAMNEIAYAATAGGAQRNPVLFPRRLFRELAALCGDRGAKAVVDAERARAIAVSCTDERAFRDVDTPADLAAIARDMMG